MPNVALRERVAPPLLAYLLASATLVTAGAIGGFEPFELASWYRFDSLHYLAIADHGYDLQHCRLTPTFQWCGNAGWFPLYPGVVAIVSGLGLSPRAAALLVENAFCVAALALLWNCGLGARMTRGNVLALGFAAFVPGVVYDHAMFPLAVASFLLLAAVLALARGRWLWAGLAGGLAAATYPTAGLFAVVAVVWLLVVRRELQPRERVRAAALVGGPCLLGFLAVLALARAQTGFWDAYFKRQQEASHGFHSPLANLVDLLTPVNAGPGGIQVFVAVQGAFVALLVVGLAAWVVRHRHGATSADWLLALYGVVFWLTPLTQGTVSYYRGDALLLPLALLVARVRVGWQVAIAAGALLVAAPMGLAFFQGVLT